MSVLLDVGSHFSPFSCGGFAFQVDEKEAQDYAESVGAVHVLCSAKTGKNVEQAFLEITKGMLKIAGDDGGGAGAGPGAGRGSKAGPSGTAAAANSRTFIDISNTTETQNKGCCS